MSLKPAKIFYRTVQAAAVASLLAFVGLVPSMSCVQGMDDSGQVQSQQADTDPVKKFDKKDAKFSLDVFIDSQGGMQVMRIAPYDPMLDGLESVDPKTPNSLRWEIQDDAGKILAVGYIPDPFHPNLGRDDVLPVESTEFQVDVPFDHGNLVLFPNTAALSPSGDEPSFRSQGGCTPHGGSLGKAKIPSSGAGGPIAQMPGLKKIVDNGICDGNVNILIAADGYTQSELGKFESDAQRMANALHQGKIFNKYWDHINIWTLAVASKESGISTSKHKKNTVFGVQMVQSHSIGCPWVYNLPAQGASLIYKAKAIITANHGGDFVKVFLSNTSDRGACGGVNAKKVAITAGYAPTKGVLAHELGHAVGGFFDEYTVGDCTNDSHESPNTTSHRNSPPWAKFGIHSVVEGADHCDNGVFKAFSHCRMNNPYDEFCDVCARVLSRRLNRKTCTSCLGIPSMCSGGTVCSYNGPQYGYCCRKPVTGSKTCGSPEECASGETCALGANDTMYCLKIDSSLKCPRKTVGN